MVEFAYGPVRMDSLRHLGRRDYDAANHALGELLPAKQDVPSTGAINIRVQERDNERAWIQYMFADVALHAATAGPDFDTMQVHRALALAIGNSLVEAGDHRMSKLKSGREAARGDTVRAMIREQALGYLVIARAMSIATTAKNRPTASHCFSLAHALSSRLAGLEGKLLGVEVAAAAVNAGYDIAQWSERLDWALTVAGIEYRDLPAFDQGGIMSPALVAAQYNPHFSAETVPVPAIPLNVNG